MNIKKIFDYKDKSNHAGFFGLALFSATIGLALYFIYIVFLAISNKMPVDPFEYSQLISSFNTSINIITVSLISFSVLACFFGVGSFLYDKFKIIWNSNYFD